MVLKQFSLINGYLVVILGKSIHSKIREVEAESYDGRSNGCRLAAMKQHA